MKMNPLSPTKLFSELKELLTSMFKAKSTEYIELELRELENIFALLLLGSFIGLPSPPTTISLRLLPYLARELIVMYRVSEKLDDMLGEMAGIFEVS